MKGIYQAMAVSGVNLLALSMSPSDATMLKPHFSDSVGPEHVRAMSDGQMRALEASHLAVFPACKWGHAAFDPVKVEFEILSPEVRSLHAQMV